MRISDWSSDVCSSDLHGAHVVFDPVGGDYAAPALRSIAWEGRYLVLGFTAGIPRVPLNLALMKSCDIRGVFWGAFAQNEHARHSQHVTQLLRWWEEGLIRPRIDRVYALAEGGEIGNATGREKEG